MGRAPWNIALVFGLCLLFLSTCMAAQKPRGKKTATIRQRPLRETATTSTTASEELLTTASERFINKETETTESLNVLFDYLSANETAFSTDAEPTIAFPSSIPRINQKFGSSTSFTDTALKVTPAFTYDEESLVSSPKTLTEKPLPNYRVSEALPHFPFDTTFKSTPLETKEVEITNTSQLTNSAAESTTSSHHMFNTTEILPITTILSTAETFFDTAPTESSTQSHNVSIEANAPDNLTTFITPDPVIINQNNTSDNSSTATETTSDTSSRAAYFNSYTRRTGESSVETSDDVLTTNNSTLFTDSLLSLSTNDPDLSTTDNATLFTPSLLSLSINSPDTSTTDNEAPLTHRIVPLSNNNPDNTTENATLFTSSLLPLSTDSPDSTSTNNMAPFEQGILSLSTYTPDVSSSGNATLFTPSLLPLSTNIPDDSSTDNAAPFMHSILSFSTDGPDDNDTTINSATILAPSLLPLTINGPDDSSTENTPFIPSISSLSTDSSDNNDTATDSATIFAPSLLPLTTNGPDASSLDNTAPFMHNILPLSTNSPDDTTDNVTLFTPSLLPLTFDLNTNGHDASLIDNTDPFIPSIMSLSTDSLDDNDTTTDNATYFTPSLLPLTTNDPGNTTDNATLFTPSSLPLSTNSPQPSTLTNTPTTTQGQVTVSAACDISLTVKANVSADGKMLSLFWEKVPDIQASLFYKIQGKKKCCRFCEGTTDVSSEVLEVPINCLNTKYTVNVNAECEGGIQGNITQLTLWTPPEAPANIKLVQRKSNFLIIKWNPPPKKEKQKQQFRVLVNDTFLYEKIPTTTFKIENLEPDTEYSVKVSANNGQGWSEWTEEFIGKTDRNPPETPKVELGFLTQTSIKVQWLDYNISSNDTSFEIKCHGEGRTYQFNTVSLFFNITNLESYTNYSVLVRAGAGKQWSPWSKEVTARTLPEAPSEPRDLQITLKRNTSIVLEWNEPAFVQEPILVYQIEWTDLEDEDPEVANTSILTYTIESLQPYTDYWVDVYAVTETMVGNASRVEVTTDIGIPSSPENLSVTDVTNTSISVQWSEPLFSHGPIEYYLVSWENGGVRNTSRTSENVFKIQQLKPYTSYSIRVRAATKKGEGEWSGVERKVTLAGIPSMPRDIRITNVTANVISMCWKPPDPFVGPLSPYRIEISQPEEDFKVVGKTVKECFSISNLEPYTNYSVRVVAVTEAGSGEPSDVIAIRTKTDVPTAPRNVTVTSSEQESLTVCWDEPLPFVGPVQNYFVSIKLIEQMNWTRAGTTAEMCFTVQNLHPYTVYLIRVRAATEAGLGPTSKPIENRTAVGVPTVPRRLTFSSRTNTSISVVWDVPEFPNGPHLTYIVQCSNLKNIDDILEIGEEIEKTFYTITGLSPFTDYSVRVRAATSAGMGVWSKSLNVKTDEGVPFEPRNVSFTSITNSSAKIQWLPPDPEVGVISNYVVRYMADENTPVLKNTKNKGISIEGLIPYTNYTVQVKAFTKAGDGKWSEGNQFRTLSGVPFPPASVRASPASNTTVKLTWSEPVPFRGPIKAYVIQLRTDGKIVGEYTTSGTEHVVSNLLPYTIYYFQVQAKTEAGPGEWSKQVGAKTYIGIPTEPRKVVTSNTTAWSISLMWQPPNPSNGPIDEYIVEWGVFGDHEKGRNDKTTEPAFEAGSLTPYTNYYFRVSAKTMAGQGPSSKEIVVQTEIAKPSEPTNLTSKASSSNSLMVSWDLPVHPNGPLLMYQIKWQALNQDPLEEEERATVNGTTWTIPSLDPYTNYTVKVAASTKVGFGPWTREVVARTDAAIPSPAHVSSVVVSGPRSLSVKWQATGVFPGPCNTTLEVYRRPGPCEPPDRALEVAALRTTQDTPSKWGLPELKIVEGLIPYSIYFVRVTMETEAGNSVSKDSKDFWTLSDVPGPPALVEIACSFSSTTAEVRWSPPKFPNGKIEHYMVMYGIKSLEWHELMVQGNDECGNQKLKISDLRPEKNYTIKVRAKVYGVSSEGPPASPGNFCILPAGVPTLGEGSFRAWGTGPHSLTIEWWKDVFSEEMGALVNFAILVGTAVGNATYGKVHEDHPQWSNFTKGVAEYYQTTPLTWNPFNENLRDPLSCEKVVSEELKRPLLRCSVGIGDSCYSGGPLGYCNGPLNPDTTYGLKLVAFTRGGFAETNPFFASTGTVPSSSWVGVLVGSLIVIVLVVAMVGYVIILKRKGKLQHVRDIFMFRPGKGESPSLAPVEQVLQMESTQLPKSLTVQNLAKHVRIMMSDSHLRFSQEFEALKRNSPKFPCSIAEMEENRTKNRWLNIFPFDHSRVKLLPLGDDPTSDYINANYIPGHSSLREYIATQGPLASTVDDFWRLVWEQSVSMLVMLTQCVERGKNKCEQYWPPPAEAKHYGDLQVRSISESMLSCYTIRMFHLQLGSQERRVKQLHFTHWPDFGCPESPEVLINFVRAVRDHLPRLRPGPILVHCSAGVGRTGTFIAVDRHSQQLPHTDLIDVYGTVMEMRQHRINMVQTEDQYIYIHLCIDQLINERNQPDDNEYEEAIYSNVGVELGDTGL